MRTIWSIFIIAALSIAIVPSLFSQSTPPWSKGKNDPALDHGWVFQVSDIDNVPDLHGHPEDAKLVLFIGGNEFFVLPELVAAFEKHHADLHGRIFYETLPPGILRKQMASNNTLTLGNFTLRIQPDVYEAGAGILDDMEKQNLVGKPVRYATNDLAIMVAASNPKQIRSLRDLDRADVRLSMPNPEWEWRDGSVIPFAMQAAKLCSTPFTRQKFKMAARTSRKFIIARRQCGLCRASPMLGSPGVLRFAFSRRLATRLRVLTFPGSRIRQPSTPPLFFAMQSIAKLHATGWPF